MDLKTNERRKITFSGVTAGNEPARLDGALTFTASPPERVEIEQIDDTSAWVYGRFNGAVTVFAEGDADLDAGETRILRGYVDLTVVNAEVEAARLDASVSEPEEV